MDWTISYIGVAIAALFAATGGATLGIMFAFATVEGRERAFNRYCGHLAATLAEDHSGEARP